MNIDSWTDKHIIDHLFRETDIIINFEDKNGDAWFIAHTNHDNTTTLHKEGDNASEIKEFSNVLEAYKYFLKHSKGDNQNGN